MHFKIFTLVAYKVVLQENISRFNDTCIKVSFIGYFNEVRVYMILDSPTNWIIGIMYIRIYGNLDIS